MASRDEMELLLLERVKQISPITLDDSVLFTQSGQGYKNSLTYISQAVNGWTFAGRSRHKLGMKYADGDSLFAIGYFQREGTEHFHLIPCKASSRKVKEVANILYKLSGSPVYIKKVTSAQKNELLQSPGFVGVDETNGWYDSAPQEDDTYPEQILDLEEIMRILETDGRPSLKDKYLRAQSRYEGRLRVEHYDPANEEHRGAALHIVLKFFESQSRLGHDFSTSEDYFNLLQLMSNSDNYFSSIFYIDDKPAAFYFAERNGDAINVYINLALYQDNPYLSEFILVHLFQKASKAGVRFANLGGSETEGLNNFKLKFHPAEQNQMHWVLYSPKLAPHPPQPYLSQEP